MLRKVKLRTHFINENNKCRRKNANENQIERKTRSKPNDEQIYIYFMNNERMAGQFLTFFFLH